MLRCWTGRRVARQAWGLKAAAAAATNLGPVRIYAEFIRLDRRSRQRDRARRARRPLRRSRVHAADCRSAMGATELVK